MAQRSADVVVIGGGIVGVTTAYFLRKKGLGVTLLERDQLARGASGRNLGFLWLHLRPKGVQLDLARAGVALYPGFVEDIGNEFEFRQKGGLIYCFTDEQQEVLAALARRRTEDGLPMELVRGNALRALCPLVAESALAATYCPEDAQINTPAFVRAMGQALVRMGCTVREGREARRIRIESGRVAGVETIEGFLPAEHVVIAAGVWSPFLTQALGIELPVFPERLGVVASAPMEPLFEQVLYGPLALKQYEIIRALPGYREDLFRLPVESSLKKVQLLECLSQRRDGTVLMGCPMDYPGYNESPSLEGVGITASVIASHLPRLHSASVQNVWAGLLPATPDTLPIIDRVPGHDGLIVATGHVFGNAAGPITGKLVAEMIAGSDMSMDITPFRINRPFPARRNETAFW